MATDPPTRLLGLHRERSHFREIRREHRERAAPKEPRGVLGDDEIAEMLQQEIARPLEDRKSTRLNSSHEWISYAVFCLKKKKKNKTKTRTYTTPHTSE